MKKITNTRKKTKRSKSILELSYEEAHRFFLGNENYCTLDLPPYIHFDTILKDVDNFLEDHLVKNKKSFSDLIDKPRDHDDINYTIFSNKDGKYAWRPIQLIHPIFYVLLVRIITEKDNWKLINNCFTEFSKNKNIRCVSIPVVSQTEEKNKAEQIIGWYNDFTQQSLILSLDFEHMLETDLTDCYGSIYTHSIAWAINGKTNSQNNKKVEKMLGNRIDRTIQDMRCGQTNGISQGSVLMDFIAEIVLGYADAELSRKLKDKSIKDEQYHILRYRDDYRIFVNDSQTGDMIVKLLTETMIELGLKLNPSKTKINKDVVQSSIKSDKLAWIGKPRIYNSLRNELLVIHEHAKQFPNSGTLCTVLTHFHTKIEKIKKIKTPLSLIGIVVDIAYHNPKTYPICAAILSKLLCALDTEDGLSIVEKIQKKFDRIPNTGYSNIWLQRITYPYNNNLIKYNDPICQLISGLSNVKIWNTDWISSRKLQKIVDVIKIVDRNELNVIIEEKRFVIPSSEIQLFLTQAEEYG